MCVLAIIVSLSRSLFDVGREDLVFLILLVQIYLVPLQLMLKLVLNVLRVGNCLDRVIQQCELFFKHLVLDSE